VDKCEYAPNGFRVQDAPPVTSLPGFAEGEFSVQDQSAQLAARLLQPESGERVLDACAAPGGKSCHLLELESSIELICLDDDAKRMERVEQNLQRLKLNATTLCGDAAKPESWWDKKQFDAILLDAPCSAFGAIRRHPDIRLLRRESDIRTPINAEWGVAASCGRQIFPGQHQADGFYYAKLSKADAHTDASD